MKYVIDEKFLDGSQCPASNRTRFKCSPNECTDCWVTYIKANWIPESHEERDIYLKTLEGILTQGSVSKIKEAAQEALRVGEKVRWAVE